MSNPIARRVSGWSERLLAVAALVLATCGLTPVGATAPTSAAEQRAEALVALLNGASSAEAQFAPAFLAQVPAAQLATINAQLRDQLGAVRRVAAIRPDGSSAATVDYAYERGTVTVRLVVTDAPPHLVTGLLITKVEVNGDSIAKLQEDFGALPGSSGLAISRLGEAAPVAITEVGGDRSLAIGSAFKLYVLAEAMRQVAAGETRWDAVVPLSTRSLPSGFLHAWPAGAPLTLHSLAGLMISQSDNSATDSLIDALGRGKIEAMQSLAGHGTPARNQPLLKTSEFFLLKGRGGSALRTRWLAGDAAGRRAMLAGELAAIDRGRFDYGSFSGPPVAIDTVEWFATPRDLVRVLDWVRRNDDAAGTARKILAINPGIGPAAAADYTYLGFKGGSEPGVVNLSFLVQSKAGAWHAVSGSWNDPKAAVDEARFVALMSRAVALAAK